MAFDSVLDHHIEGDGLEQQTIINLFDEQAVTTHREADGTPTGTKHTEDLPIFPFYGGEPPWASRTTSDRVNESIKTAQYGRLRGGALAHGWVHCYAWLEFWFFAAREDVVDDVAAFQDTVDHLAGTPGTRGVPQAVQDLARIIETQPEAVQTPVLQFDDSGSFIFDPDGLRRASALLSLERQTGGDTPRYLPVYIHVQNNQNVSVKGM